MAHVDVISSIWEGAPVCQLSTFHGCRYASEYLRCSQRNVSSGPGSATQASAAVSSHTISRPRARREMPSTVSQVASATSISLHATRRPSSHSQPGKSSVSLETHERLSIPSGTPNRRLNRHGSLKPTSDNPLQTRTHTKNPTTRVKKRKGNKHQTEEQYKQRIVMQQTVIDALQAQIAEKPHQCPKCSKSSKRSDHVRSHIRLKHPELAPSLDKIYCEKCEKRFTRSAYLAQHTCAPKSRSKYGAFDLKYVNSHILVFSNSTGSSPASLRAVSGRLVYLDFSYSTHENVKTP